MKQVKGTWILNFVKVIRSNKAIDFDQWLHPADWEVIKTRILPSSWYPYESFLRMGLALFKGVARENLEITRAFGRLIMQDHLKIYQNILVEGDPAASMEKFCLLKRTFFGDIASFMAIDDQGSNHSVCKLGLTAEDSTKETADAFSHLLAGNLEELVIRAGGEGVTTDTNKVDDGFLIRVSWL